MVAGDRFKFYLPHSALYRAHAFLLLRVKRTTHTILIFRILRSWELGEPLGQLRDEERDGDQRAARGSIQLSGRCAARMRLGGRRGVR